MAQTFTSDQNLPATGCTRQNIYDLLHFIRPLIGLVDTNVLNVLSNQITAGDRLPYWRKYSKVFSDFSAGATTNNIELFQLPAGGVIHTIKLKHSAAFTGGAISAYTLSVGIASSLARYLAATSVFAAPTATNYALTDGTPGGESHTAVTSIKIAATSTGANLSAATAGAVDIWVAWSVCT